MNKPLVSVIVPTIGRPVFFQKALASVAAQTYPNLEIFVSDNAAETPVSEQEVSSACGAHPFRLVRREKRLGFADHFNICLKEASGEFAMFLSDDDLLVPRFVETAVDCLGSDSSVGAGLSRQTRIEESFLGGPPEDALTWSSDLSNVLYDDWWTGAGNPDVLTFVSLFGRRMKMVRAGGFGNDPSGAHSDIQLLLELTLGRRLGYLFGGFLYRVYPTSVGLGMSWPHLRDGTIGFERVIQRWVKEGRMTESLRQALVRNHTSSMIGRYRRLYRKRPGFVNKVRRVLDLFGRIARSLIVTGPKSVPVLHRIVGS